MRDATVVNFYAVLGVAAGASDEEIHRAYRRLAFQLHPDRNPSPDAVTMFVAVAEACEALCDPAQRAALDDHLAATGHGSCGAPEPADPSNPTGATTAGVDDIEAVVWGRSAGVLRTQSFEVERLETCPACRECINPLCDRCQGTGFLRARRRLRVRIPPNVRDGSTLRLRRAGHVAPDGVTRGDVRVTVRIATTGPAGDARREEPGRTDGSDASVRSRGNNEDPVRQPHSVSAAQRVEVDPHDALEWFARRAEELGKPDPSPNMRRPTPRGQRRRRLVVVVSATALLVTLFVVSGGLIGGAAGALCAAVVATVCVCRGAERLCSIVRDDANSAQARAVREAVDRLKRHP